MTGMPELVAIFNGLGGAASLLVGWTALYASVNISLFSALVIVMSLFIGSVTLSGSLVAFGKLSGKISSGKITFLGQKFVNLLIVAILLGAGCMLIMEPSTNNSWFWIILGGSLLFGIMLVLPIGGADMPVIISMLNAFSGLAACTAGLILDNNLLIVSGSLVGASGVILTNIMCKAMNRTLISVLLSGFNAAKTIQGSQTQGEVKSTTAQDAYYILEAAQRVVIIPGYGMAVSQAQHAVKELKDKLEENNCEVFFAIHPVAGRMPGHMNVLLAEANIPYEQLVEMDEINPQMSSMDVALVIGAIDVVNPSANSNPDSPLYGMPVINVTEARTVFILKRSMNKGFSDVDNPLFYNENSRMLFGDGKDSLSALANEFSD